MPGQNPESRSTFREASEACWQKQIRDRYNHIPGPAVELDLSAARIKRVDVNTAKKIIHQYEWLGTMGAGTVRNYGIFFGMFCAGVTCYACSGAVAVLAKTFRVETGQLSYLTRGACVHWAPKGTNSKLISHSCRMEREHGIKIVVAFADSDAGEVGTVYQASNWTYIGKSETGWKQFVSAQGKIWSWNALCSYARINKKTTAAVIDGLLTRGWRMQMSNPKGRYVYILDRADRGLVDLVDSMRQPYPKRATGVATQTNATPVVQLQPARSKKSCA
jgi:hypothetical protein